MVTSVHVEIPRLQDVVGKIHGMTAEIKAQQRAAMTKATDMLAGEVKSRIHTRRPGVKGSAREGIKPRVNASGNAGYVNTKNKAAKFSQLGRPPGRMPRPKTIAKKFGLEPDEAFLVARAIARRGTKGQSIMAPTLRDKRPEVDRIFHEAVKRVVRTVR